jgi:hypothetical protein
MIKTIAAAAAMSLVMYSAAGADTFSSAAGLNGSATYGAVEVSNRGGNRGGGHARAGGGHGHGRAIRSGFRGGRRGYGGGGYGYGGGWGGGVCTWVGPVWVCP